VHYLRLYLNLISMTTSRLHLPPLQSQLMSLVLPVALPILMIALIYVLWLATEWILVPALKSLSRRLHLSLPKKPSVTFEITFPARSDKTHLSTGQFFSALHSLDGGSRFYHVFARRKSIYAFEIGATPEGIRFYLHVPAQLAESVSKSLLAYIPSLVIEPARDFLTASVTASARQAELKLSSDFALPLKAHEGPSDYDPLAYLTGQMAKLEPGELAAYQIVASPIRRRSHVRVSSRINRLRRRIAAGSSLSPEMTGLADLPRIGLVAFKLIGYVVLHLFLFALSIVMSFLPGPDKPGYSDARKPKTSASLTPSETELADTVRRKLDQPLFETTIRLLAVSPDRRDAKARLGHLTATLAPFTAYPQSLKTRLHLPGSNKRRLARFIDRRHSPELLRLNPVLSSSELSSLYHFPRAPFHPEGLAKSKSRQLPAPVIAASRDSFDVVLGKTRYGNSTRPIGLSLAQRRRHTYIIGKTGTGKTTLMTAAIYQDMLSGHGLAVLDPHGDMFKELLGLVSPERQDDVIVFDPADGDWPIALNILQPGISFATEDDRLEWITSAVISVFQKLSDERYWGPKMEHILRNTTLTALRLPNPTLYTIQQLLTSRPYRKSALAAIDDPILKNFWDQEFALMGSMQLSASIGPITHRLGQFLTSPRARNILLQPETSLNIESVMDDSKILLVNLSKGELGEDQSRFFGTLLTSLIWMGAYQRTRLAPDKRPDFFLYIDEFQNFATARFADIASEGRKFGLALTTAHQNVAQIKDPAVLKTITANASTIICLQASPDDEQFIIPFMQPDVAQGDITNLEPHQFFMKTSGPAMGAFSGQTMELALTPHVPTKNQVISLSRARYAKPKADVQTQQKALLTPTALKSAPERPTVRVSNKSKLAFAEMIESPPRARVKKTQK